MKSECWKVERADVRRETSAHANAACLPKTIAPENPMMALHGHFLVPAKESEAARS